MRRTRRNLPAVSLHLLWGTCGQNWCGLVHSKLFDKFSLHPSSLRGYSQRQTTSSRGVSCTLLSQVWCKTLTLVRTQREVLYKWSRQKCTGLHWYAHTEGYCTDGAGRSVQVTLVRTHKGVLNKWSRRKCTGLVHGHGMRRTEKERTRRTVKSRASPRDCFLFFRLDKVRVPYKSGSTSCEKCPLTCKDGLCGKIWMLCL